MTTLGSSKVNCQLFNKFVKYSYLVFRHQAIAEAGDQLRQWLDDGSGYKEGMYHRKQYIQFVKPGIG